MNTKELQDSVKVVSKLIKHPKLKVDSLSQFSLVIHNNVAYLVGYGMLVPNNRIRMVIKLSEVAIEDTVYLLNLKEILNVFTTLGEQTTLSFEAEHLGVYSENNGLVTNIELKREQPFNNDTTNVLSDVNSLVVKSIPSDYESNIIDTKDLNSKLTNLLSIKNNQTRMVTFEEDKMSIQDFSYVLQEQFDFGFKANIPFDIIDVLKSVFSLEDTGNIALESNNLFFENSCAYVEVTNLSTESHDLSKFVQPENMGIKVSRESVLNSLSLLKHYTFEDTVIVFLEDTKLRLTTQSKREGNKTLPTVTLDIVEKGSDVVDKCYGINGTIFKGLLSVVESETVELYFDTSDMKTNLLYVVNEDSKNFMYLDVYE